MLTHIVMCAISGFVLYHQSFVMLSRYDIYHSGNGVTAIESRRGSLYNLYSFDIVRVDKSEVVLSSHIAMYPFPVDENKDIRISQSVHLHLRTHVSLLEVKRRRQLRQDIFNRTSCEILQCLTADNLRLYGRIFQ